MSDPTLEIFREAQAAAEKMMALEAELAAARQRNQALSDAVRVLLPLGTWAWAELDHNQHEYRVSQLGAALEELRKLVSA